MKMVCKTNKCVGCRACEELCTRNAITIEDQVKYMNAVIDETRCIDCKICDKVCQVNHPLEKKSQVAWFQGWSKDDEIREKSSSGGLAAEISRKVVNEGGIVCSCKFENGQFIFKFVECVDELKDFAGSKYVKSNPTGVYKGIRKYLNNGRTVLFIGLPCQCAAVKKATVQITKGQLYTVDLICHGTPSSKILETFMQQYGCSLKQVQSIRFRDKENFFQEQNETHIVTSGTMDCYSIAFLNGLIYTENCYECVYADSKRITDLTIGDSWGTELSGSERGISLILCNTERGKELVERTGIYMANVNIEKAKAFNPQLREPTVMPTKRAMFFNGYENGKKFNSLVMKCCTQKWFRQFVKRQLIRAKIIGKGTFGISYKKYSV